MQNGDRKGGKRMWKVQVKENLYIVRACENSCSRYADHTMNDSH